MWGARNEPSEAGGGGSKEIWQFHVPRRAGKWSLREGWPSGCSCYAGRKGNQGAPSTAWSFIKQGKHRVGRKNRPRRDQRLSRSTDGVSCLIWNTVDNYKQISESHEPVYKSGFKQSSKRKNLIAFSEPGLLVPEGPRGHSRPHSSLLPLLTDMIPFHPRCFQVSRMKRSCRWSPILSFNKPFVFQC